MKLIALAALATLASGCDSTPPLQHASGPPPGKVQQRNGPPRAWLETSAAPQWLGGGSYCWHFKDHGVCADAVAPSCDQSYIPHFRVAPGATVRAHLGFTPEQASLGGEAGTVEPSTLHNRTLEWKVSQGGVFSVFATVSGGDASYVGCLDLTS